MVASHIQFSEIGLHPGPDEQRLRAAIADWTTGDGPLYGRLASALGDGMTAPEYDKQTQASLRRVGNFLRRVMPPGSPYRPDFAAVNRGRAVYLNQCAQCHDAKGARTLTVIPVEEVDTDRHRIDMWTTAARDAYNNYRTGYDWDFSHFQKVSGYVAEPLDGLWLRAPYLHNGAVPTLADLL